MTVKNRSSLTAEGYGAAFRKSYGTGGEFEELSAATAHNAIQLQGFCNLWMLLPTVITLLCILPSAVKCNPAFHLPEGDPTDDLNTFMITDDTPADHLVGKVRLPTSNTFPDSKKTPSNDRQYPSWSYQVLGALKMPGQLFRVNKDTGELFTREKIDREVVCSPANIQNNFGQSIESQKFKTSHQLSPDTDCFITLQIAINPTGQQAQVPQFVFVKVIVVDRNDHMPTFPHPGYINLSVPESAEVGSRFPLPLAVDLDTRQYSVRAYVAEPQLPAEWALISETDQSFSPKTSGSQITALFLELRKPLDHEKIDRFSFRIRALDGAEQSEFAPVRNGKDTLQVNIYVEDINDNGPVFRRPEKSFTEPNHFPVSDPLNQNWLVTYTATVPESKWIKTPIVQLLAEDIDSPAHAKVRYYFGPSTDREVLEYFTINAHSGHLFLRKPLDYEFQAQYSFRVIATDTADEPKLHSASQTLQTPSSIHTATAQVIIYVTDTNDEAPNIEVDFLSTDTLAAVPRKYAVVAENAAPPQFIASILVTDRDAGINGQVNCVQQAVISSSPWPSAGWTNTSSISQFHLSEVRQSSGLVQYNLLTSVALDRENVAEGGAFRQVKITCTDAGRPAKSASTFIGIKVKDENDNVPEVKLRMPTDYRFASGSRMDPERWPFVVENSPLGTLVTRLNATDLDEGENGRLTFSLENSDGTEPVTATAIFQINSKTGDIITKGEIDREAYDPPLFSIPLRVRVSDNGIPPKSSTFEFKVYILDENDNPPVFQQSEYKFHVRENLPAGYPVGEILVSDKDEGEVKLTLSLQPYGTLPFVLWAAPTTSRNSAVRSQASFTVNRVIINTTRPLDREVEESFRFTVLATDAPSFPSLSSHDRAKVSTVTATVEVIVENENDHDPVIIFPQKQNKTFILSSQEKKHFELLTINANDKDPNESPHIFELFADPSQSVDDGQDNSSTANTTRSLRQPADAHDFLDVEPTTGIVYLSRDMRPEDKGFHVFKVQVTDGGTPPRSSSIAFFVLVNDSPSRSLTAESIPSTIDTIRKEPLSDTGFPAKSVPTMGSAEVSIPKVSRVGVVGRKTASENGSSKARPRIAGDLVILLALGLVFLLLVATVSLVAYMRYWRKHNRLIGNRSVGLSNRNSLLFANQINGGTGLKELRCPPTETCISSARKQKTDQWLCTGDGSIIGLSSHLLDDDALKCSFPSTLISDCNVYYKASEMARSQAMSDNSYSPLSPSASVLMKSPSPPDHGMYMTQDAVLLQDAQLACYAQNMRLSQNEGNQRQQNPTAYNRGSSEVLEELSGDAEGSAFTNKKVMTNDGLDGLPVIWNQSCTSIKTDSPNFLAATTSDASTAHPKNGIFSKSARDNSYAKLHQSKSRQFRPITECHRSESDGQLVDTCPASQKHSTAIPFVLTDTSAAQAARRRWPTTSGNCLRYKMTPLEESSYTTENRYGTLHPLSADEADAKEAGRPNNGPTATGRSRNNLPVLPQDYILVLNRPVESMPASAMSSPLGKAEGSDTCSAGKKSAMKKKPNLEQTWQTPERSVNPWTSYV
ncbi:hypothetical protein AAHC03_01314 [Spirometra sp. Aus1]